MMETLKGIISMRQTCAMKNPPFLGGPNLLVIKLLRAILPWILSLSIGKIVQAEEKDNPCLLTGIVGYNTLLLQDL